MSTPNSKMDLTWLRSALRLRILMRKRVYGWRAAFKLRQWRDYCHLAVIWLRSHRESTVAQHPKPWRFPRDGRGADC